MTFVGNSLSFYFLITTYSILLPVTYEKCTCSLQAFRTRRRLPLFCVLLVYASDYKNITAHSIYSPVFQSFSVSFQQLSFHLSNASSAVLCDFCSLIQLEACPERDFEGIQYTLAPHLYECMTTIRRS